MEPEIHEAFTVHMLNDQGKAKATRLASAFSELLRTISVMCPPGRELSIVTTKLEEASFFAKKAMAKQGENQQ